MADEGTMEGGRLEVPVEADLSGFARELKTKVEAAAEAAEAKIDVVLNESTLRERLEAAIKKASAGLAAEIDLRFNRRQVARALGKTVAQAANKVPPVPIDVRASTKGNLPAQVAASTAAAQATADANPVEVPVELDRRRLMDSLDGLLARLRQRITEGLTPAGAGGGGAGGGLLSHIFSGGAFASLFKGGGRGSRFAFRFLIYGGLASLIQPIVAALGQLAAGLVAVVGAAAPALGVIGALPGLLAGLLQSIIGLTIAFSGVGEAIGATGPELEKLARGEKLTRAETEKLNEAFKNMAPEVKDFAVKLVGLKDEWIELRKDVQKPVFSALARQIEPVAKRLLPVLREGFVGTGRSLHRLINLTGRWLSSRLFAKDAATIMRGNNLLLDHFGRAMLFLAKATTDFLVASQPFLKRVGEGAERFAEWVAEITKAGRESGKIERFLDRAGDKAKQVGTILIDLTKGFFGIFSASVPAGEEILDRMERKAREFAEWANGDGRNDIRAFFNEALPGFFEMVRLLGEIGRALGRMMRDGNIDEVIAQVTDDLLPAVEHLLTVLGQQVGPKVIDLLTSVVEALDKMSAVGAAPLGVLVEILDTLVDLFNLAAEAFPPLAPILGTILGSLLAFKILKPVLKPVVGFLSLLASGKVRTALSRLAKGGGLLKGLGLGAGAAALGGAGGKGGGLFGRGIQRVTWGPAPLPVFLLAGPGAGGKGGKGGKGKGLFGKIGGGFGKLLGALGLGGLLGGSLFGGGGGGKGTASKGGLFGKIGKVLGKGGIAGILGALGVGFLSDQFIADGKGGGRDALAGGLTGAASGAGIGALIGSIVPGIGTAVGGLVGGGIGGVAGVIGGLGGLDEAKKKIGEFASSVGAKFEEMKTGAIAKAAELAMGAGNWFQNLKTGGVAKAAELAAGAGNWFQNLKTRGIVRAAELASGAGNWFQNLKTRGIVRAAELAAGAGNWFQNLKTGGVAKAAELALGAGNKFQELKTNGIAKVAELASGIGEQWSGMISGALTAGLNLAQSLASGIESGISAAVNAASKLGNAAIGAAKFVLGIESPSKVFTQFGAFVARGLAGGISGNTSLAVKAASQMARLVGQAGAPGFGVGDLFRSQRLAAAGLAPAGGGGGTVFSEGAFQINNPLPERASDSLTRAMQKIVYLGFGGED